MSMLTTPVDFEALDRRIHFDDQLFAMGSCFAQHTARRLQQHKALMHAHPFGILFNPASMARSVKLINKELSFAEPMLHDGACYCLDAHGDLHAADVGSLKRLLESRREAAAEAWEQATHICLTFGTAAVYEHTDSGLIVANCHRLPAREFSRYLLSVEDIVEIWSEIIDEFSQKQFLFSVSPVRHLRDGLNENTISKATLHLALQQLCNSHLNATYVPVYELFIDELRDYRFYARDMCHPSEVALDIVWQRFLQSCTSYEMQDSINEIADVVQATQHQPRHPESASHQQFCQQQLDKVKDLQQRFPDRDWSAELDYFLQGSLNA